MESMEKLDKRGHKEGLKWDDFKNNIRTRLLTRSSSSRVGSHITLGRDDCNEYTKRNKKDFVEARASGARGRSRSVNDPERQTLNSPT